MQSDNKSKEEKTSSMLGSVGRMTGAQDQHTAYFRDPQSLSVTLILYNVIAAKSTSVEFV